MEYPSRHIVLLAIGSLVTYYGGKPFFEAAKGEVVLKNWGVMTLVSLVLSKGCLFSVISTLFFPGRLCCGDINIGFGVFVWTLV